MYLDAPFEKASQKFLLTFPSNFNNVPQLPSNFNLLPNDFSLFSAPTNLGLKFHNHDVNLILAYCSLDSISNSSLLNFET